MIRYFIFTEIFLNQLNANRNYDVAIIGAGIGGLTAACLLCKSGLKVALVEKEPHAGGYLAGFQRKGYRFDTAIHWLNQCSENGLVTKIFRLIGSDHPVCKTHQKIRRYKGERNDFLLTADPEQMKDALIKKFPGDKDGIERFFKTSKKIGNSLNHFKNFVRASETLSFIEKAKNGLRMLRFVLPFIPLVRYEGSKMKNGLDKYFKNDELKKLFAAETDLLSCIVPVGWAYHADYQYPPEGGGQVIPEWMIHYLKTQDCEMFFNAPVQNILVENGTAKGLLINQKGKEKILHAKYVIAACDLNLIYKDLLPRGTVPQEKIKKLNEAEIYASSFTVSIALNCPTEQLGLGEEMIHLFKEDVARELQNSGDPEKSALTILTPSITDKSLAPDGCGTLVIFMPAYMHQHNNWQTGSDLERSSDYIDLKKQVAEKLIKRVEQAIAPGLSNHIVFYDAATPITHWRYTGNQFGTMMGTKPGRKNMQTKVAGYVTPVKNLFIGGHWAELGGGVPIASKAGMNAALLVLKQHHKKAFDELVEYFEDKKTALEINQQNIFKPYSNDWKRRKTAAEKYFQKT